VTIPKRHQPLSAGALQDPTRTQIVRDRHPDEPCALCGQGPGEPCRNVFAGERLLVLDWMHFQPMRRASETEAEAMRVRLFGEERP
jgi:hypothetical protein